MARYKGDRPLGMSERQYGKHRGVARTTIAGYRRMGYLVLCEDGSIDATASDRRLAGILDPTRRRDPGGEEVRLSLAAIRRLFA